MKAMCEKYNKMVSNYVVSTIFKYIHFKDYVKIPLEIESEIEIFMFVLT